MKKKLIYKIRNFPNMLRSYCVLFGCWVGSLFGGVTAYGTVKAVHINADGEETDLGIIGHKMVTTAGVTFMATDFMDGSTDISNFKYHGSGTGVGSEATGDTALGTEVTDNARVAGTNTNPTATQYQSVATIAYTGAHAITEHGVFNQATVAGSILWDRTVFAAINVQSGDSIQFTYLLSITAGG